MPLDTTKLSCPLTPADMEGMLYEETRLLSFKPRSKTSKLDYTPRIVSRACGEFVKIVDPEQERLTVFLFPTHAEVWLTKEWVDSSSRRERGKERQRVYQKDAYIRSRIRKGLEAANVPKQQDILNKMANALATCGRQAFENLGLQGLYNEIEAIRQEKEDELE